MRIWTRRSQLCESGLARAHGLYQQGVHIAGKVNDMYQIGKRVAAIALPHMDQYLPGIQAGGITTIGHMEGARGEAMHRLEDVQEKIRDHGRVWQQIEEQVPQARPNVA